MRRQWALLTAYILTYALIAGIITWVVRYITGPEFILSEVNIVGQSDIKFDSQLFKKQNLLFLDTQIISEDLLKNPQIKSVKIYKKFPNKLEILVEEATPSVLLITSDNSYFLESNGKVLPNLERYNQIPTLLVKCRFLTVINGTGQQIQELIPLITLMKKIQDYAQIHVTEVVCLNQNHYRIYSPQQEILIDTAKDPEVTSASLLF